MCQSFGFLSLYSERQCRALQEMWEKERGRPAAKDLRLVCRRGLCTLNLFSTCLSVSRNYWTDFHFTWMEDESQCTLDHVIFCCGGISSHFLKRWQIMCGSGWEQFHSAPTMKSDGNSCWEGWNTVVSVWVGLKVRLLDWEAANLSDKLVKCLNRRFLIWRLWWSRAVTFRIGLYVLTVFSSTSESSTSTFVLL